MSRWLDGRFLAAKHAIYSRPKVFRGLQVAWHAIIGPREITRQLIRKRQLKAFSTPRTVKVTAVGATFSIAIAPKNGLVDDTIFATGSWDPDLSHALAALLEPGDVFVDVRANIGYFSLLAAHLVGEHGIVFAFEPLAPLAEQLRASVATNGFSNVRVKVLACGDSRGTAQLHLIGSNLGASSLMRRDQSSRTCTIDVAPLDDVLRDEQRVDLIKLDVEGYELDVLSGAQRILEKHAPLVALEFSPVLYEERRSGSSQKLLDLLARFSYTLRYTNGKSVAQPQDLVRELLLRKQQRDLICVPPRRASKLERLRS